MDCPEDEKTYIHRVGRTARLEAAGNSEEEGMGISLLIFIFSFIYFIVFFSFLYLISFLWVF